MGQKRYRVQVGEEIREYPEGTFYGEIAQDFQKNYDSQIMLAVMNGKLAELRKPLDRSGSMSFVTDRESIGHSVYVRTAVLILLKAIYDVGGHSEVDRAVVHYSLGNALYFTLEGKTNLNQEFLEQVKAQMQQIVAADLVLEKTSLETEDAIQLFHRHHMYDKEKLFHYRRGSRVNLYSLGSFDDYFYGYMAYSSGCIRYFDLELYDEGFVLILPRRQSPQTLEPFCPMTKIFQVQKESQVWGEKMKVATVGDLNERIAKEGAHQILLIQEALQEAKIARIAEKIAERGNVKFVMIAGPSSSGKTSFSHRLSIQLTAQGLVPHPIAVDNYFKNRNETPLDEFGEKNYECLEAIDVEGFNRDMTRLLQGEKVELPVYNFVTGEREYKGDFLQLGPEDILVIEGIHGLNEKLSYSLPRESKFKIYISALTQLNIDEHNRIPTTDGRLIRRMVRDARTRGTSASETIQRWPSVRRGEEQYIFPFQEEADVMFNSALVYELACLKVYAEPLLFGIDRSAPEYVEAKRLLKFLDYFLPVPSEEIPRNSLLREFVGGSAFPV